MSAPMFTLSAALMQDLEVDNVQEDFVFRVGAGEYSCSRGLARVLSRRVSVQSSVDCSLSEYLVDPNDSTHKFELFMSVIEGSSIALQSRLVATFFGFREM
jgi:hypothetical protein